MLTTEEVQQVLDAIKQNPELLRDTHLYSDVDYATDAQHHTLGVGPGQASPGSHTHLGDAVSKAISQLIAAGKKVIWDGTTLTVPGKLTSVETLSNWAVGIGEINNWSDDGTGDGAYFVRDHWCHGFMHSRTTRAGDYPDPWGFSLPVSASSRLRPSGGFNLTGNPIASIIGSWSYRRSSDGAFWTGPLIYTKSDTNEAGPFMIDGASRGMFSIQPGVGDSVSILYSYPTT